MPVLKLPDGFEAGQSRAIWRYLAKLVKHNGAPLYPQDPREALLVDEIGDAMEDIWRYLAKLVKHNGAPLYP